MRTFELHDSLFGQIQARGVRPVLFKLMMTVLKGTLAFLPIAFILAVFGPSTVSIKDTTIAFACIWGEIVAYLMILAFGPRYALGGEKGVGFDTFSPLDYERCDWSDISMVEIHCYALEVAHYILHLSKAGRKPHQVELFVRQSLEESKRVRDVLEGNGVRVNLIEPSRDFDN